MAKPFFAPEILQLSTMDCGVAAVSCMLRGLGRTVSYELLREACQTAVDGTSIDALEDLCLGFGLDVCQHVVPADLFIETADARMPVVAVLQHERTAALHYVCVWSRVGARVQVMNPSGGRTWMKRAELERSMVRYALRLSIVEWRAWVESSAYRTALERRARSLLPESAFARIAAPVFADLDPATFSALDAALRLVALASSAQPSMQAATREALVQRTFRAALEGRAPDSIVRVRVEGGDVLTSGTVYLGASDRAVDLEARRSTQAGAAIGAPSREGRSGGAGDWAVLGEAARMIGPSGRSLLGWLGAGAVGLALATTAELVVYRAAVDAPRLFATWHLRLTAAAVVGTLALLLVGLEWLLSTGSRRVGRALELELRRATLAALPRVSDAFVRTRPASDLAFRAHALASVGGLAHTVVSSLSAFADVLVTLVAIALVDVRYGIVAAAGAALFSLPWLVARVPMQEADTRLQVHASRTLSLLTDALRGIRPLRLHGLQDALRDEQIAANELFKAASDKSIEVSARLDASLGAASAAVLAALLATMLAVHGDPRVLVVLILWAFRLPPAVSRFVDSVKRYPLQRNALARILEVTRYVPAAVPTTESAAAGGVSIHMRGVDVVAGGQPVLSAIDFDVARGEHVAIVGPSGAGKSSIVGLLLGFHRPASGALEVDGRAYDEAALEALRDRVVWVDAAGHLWNRTIGDNVDYAASGLPRRATHEVLDAADLVEVLAGADRGLDTPVGAEGAFVSGGEGQRVRVGRGLARADARLVLLDEPFRGLEREARTRMLARMREAFPSATLLFVSHDLSDTRAFPRVIVVEAGRIVEDGPPQALARDNSRYRALLDAEERLRREAWTGRAWRVLRVGGGAVREEEVA